MPSAFYPDIEFKLRHRQKPHLTNLFYSSQAPISTSLADAIYTSDSSNSLDVDLNRRFGNQTTVSQFLAPSRSLSVASTSSSIASSESKSESFYKNMIAKLSTSGGHQSYQSPQSSTQTKRKRVKLLDLLLNANWSKQSQQASNLVKLNKILFLCDANFLDEKTGESPLSLVISSPQINPTGKLLNGGSLSAGGSNAVGGCPQSASLFNLQCQSVTGYNQMMLQQTSISDLSHSQAPLVERLLLLLVKSGAQIDFRNNDGRTPLHIAAMKSNFWALKTLLDLGASTDYRDINGLTPLYYSILHKANLKVSQLLLSHRSNSCNGSIMNPSFDGGPTIGVTDQQGWQETHQACKLGLDAHLEKLLYYGCDINAKISGSGNTPLHVAAINDQLNCAKVLLLRGADKTITNNSHQTAHQVAVISNNMDLAEFISEHNETKVVLFRERPANFSSSEIVDGQSTRFSIQSSTRSSIAASRSSNSLASSGPQKAIVQPQVQHMNPLMLDVAQTSSSATPSLTSNSQSQSLLMAQIGGHANNISPCLSQRSYATSNTTSSSGVCCDGDGNNSAEENHNHTQMSNSHSQHSSVTVIANDNKNLVIGNLGEDQSSNYMYNDEEGEDLRSSGSSSNGLYSLMSEERPLFAGTIVRATSDYQSGDPNHLQLRRGDLIEVLEFNKELLQGGQMPRLAGKPMLLGCRRSDNQAGLFPSFCVERAKQKQSISRQKPAMPDITNPAARPFSQINELSSSLHHNETSSTNKLTISNVQGKKMTNSQSMAAMQTMNQVIHEEVPFRQKFNEIQVTLTKSNENGFGFVLRGAKVDPSTLIDGDSNNSRVLIDERLMEANNLVSLQYLDEIESGSAADLAGLKRGDFLVSVNNQDVRLRSHEQVVHMIRQSGIQVQLTIATPIPQMAQNQPIYYSKTLGKVKPAPPKRDPTTTLTRNKSQRVKSMIVQPQRHEHFDADKPLPQEPACNSSYNGQLLVSPTSSLNTIGRSVSTNLSHFNSAQSLSSATPDTQSISSVSTISADHHQREEEQGQSSSQQQTPTRSSSSTTTLTTVAATVRPKAPPKPKSQFNDGPSMYQSAVITTTTRRSTKTDTESPKTTPKSNQTFEGSLPSQPAPCPPPPPPPPSFPSTSLLPLPPPPPPLPEFPSSPISLTKLNQRRISMPADLPKQMVISSSQLLKKRESLSAVSQSVSPNVPAPAEFGAVAAACAAAANNRMQRQQQRQQEEEIQKCQDKLEKVSLEEELKEDKTEDEAKPIMKEEVYCFIDSEEKAQVESKPSEDEINVEELQPEMDENRNSKPLVSPIKQPNRQQTSSTLGRKASAQIIQQPKQGSQSQTLRPKPRRPNIPDYDQLPPPPPPLPHCDQPNHTHRLSNSMQMSSHPIVNHVHQYHEQQHIYHPEMTNPTLQPAIRQTQDLAMMQQQQLIRHQSHQQQLLQQQQQLKQIQLQQQQLCLNTKHAGHDHHHHHHHHGQYYSTQAGRSLNTNEIAQQALVTRQQQQHYRQQQQQVAPAVVKSHSHHHSHHHRHQHHHQPDHAHSHHSHNHNHDQMTTAMMQHHHQKQYVQHPNLAHGQHSQQQVMVDGNMMKHHHHNHPVNQQHQQQLYQQQQNFADRRYMQLVYNAETYANRNG